MCKPDELETEVWEWAQTALGMTEMNLSFMPCSTVINAYNDYLQGYPDLPSVPTPDVPIPMENVEPIVIPDIPLLEKKRIEIIQQIGTIIPPYRPDHYESSDGGVRWWMCNKIRKLLANIKNKYGYPVRYHRSMDTYSGVMFWINQEFRCYPAFTSERWKLNPDEAWRIVCIQRQDLDFYGDLIADLIKTIPIVNELAGAFFELTDIDIVFLPIYENVSFYNTMNDVLIYANWDKIKNELSYEGF